MKNNSKTAMNEPSSERKKASGQWIPTMFFMAIGVVCGLMMVDFAFGSTESNDTDIGIVALKLAALFAGMYIAIFIQITIHEAGHLMFGLMTGYRFSSFRIGSLMLTKEKGKIKLKILKVAGTGGQCLMQPPEPIDGKFPVALYNLGGSLLNACASIIFMLFYFLCTIPLISRYLLMLSVIGFIIAAMNGVPMRMGIVDNDGYNAFSLRKNSAALRSFWIQMKSNELMSEGVRLKDMPKEWFAVPSDEEMKNSMTAVIGVLVCNRLLDEQRCCEAYELMRHMLEIDSGIVGLHHSMMICDCIFCELLGDNRRERLEELLDKQQRNFMKSMKKSPSVLRTEYAYALLAENNAEKSLEIKGQFEKIARTYPYQCEIESGRELMELADKKAKVSD